MQHNELLDYQTMLEQSLGAHAVFAKNTIVFCNHAFESITGYSRRELLGMAQRALHILFKDGDGDLLHRLVRLCQKGDHVSYHPEIRLVTKKGRTRWIEISLCSFNYQGKPAAHLSFFDTTEAKERYDAVCDMANACWEMLNTATILAVMLDPRGMVVYCNDSMLDAIGWKREEILGRNWFDECVGEHGAKKRYLGHVGRYTAPIHGEYDLVTREGARRPFVWSGSILRDCTGALSGVMFIGEDRTELKRTELELRTQHEKFVSVIDYADEGFVLVDDEGAVTAWNRGIERISGIVRNEALGQPLWEVMYRMMCDEYKSPESHELEKLFIEEILATGIPGEPRGAFETIQRPDGMRRKVRRSFFIIPSPRWYRVGVMIKDITEEIGLLETLRRYEQNCR